MKVIFSRKGFDGQYGRVPSPILPDGRLLSLPIPSKQDACCYSDIQYEGIAVGDLVESLTSGSVIGTSQCHLDPDLVRSSRKRLSGWRPCFGQIDVAQAHLTRQSVAIGDLFLFFGWFRRVERVAETWRYVRNAPDLHVFFGWLHIGEVIRLGRGERPKPLEAFADHPHLSGRDRSSNTLYLASDRFRFRGIDMAGAGTFPRVSDSRILTDRTQGLRSQWLLPPWMHPTNGAKLSYHGDPSRWQLSEVGSRLKSAAKGQEFVLSSVNSVLLGDWLSDLFEG